MAARSTKGRPTAARDHRLKRLRQERPGAPQKGSPKADAMIDCGWGRLIFAHTFDSNEALVQALRAEGPDRRDIAFYVPEPQVALSLAPQELFLDPSVTYRLDLSQYRPARKRRQTMSVRRLTTEEDAEAVNRIYAARQLVPVDPAFFWRHRDARTLSILVAEDVATGEIVGTVMGVDHARAFDDPQRGASLWCLAVAPTAPHGGIGEALVRRLAEHFQARGAAYLDLSVLHDNAEAIALYEKLGFRKVGVYAIKRKNPINEKLFTGTAATEGLNPYAAIIVDEARRRGIGVEVFDAEAGLFRLSYGGRSVRCREALSEFTSAVAFTICDDKALTHKVVGAAGVKVPEQIPAGDEEAHRAFLDRHGKVVVKPARGEQGRGVAVGLSTPDDIAEAVERARQISDDVVIEAFFPGHDLRLVVIDFRVVAAAIRRPARIVGDGVSTVRKLIEVQSRRRAAATAGESRIPMDAETERCLADAGLGWDDVPDTGREIAVRRTANLHTGGTIEDVTDIVHPDLVAAAIRAARAIDIPVTGIDLMVAEPDRPDYVFIEANERPGLANHEPQPTAERFIDLLFPLSIPVRERESGWRLDE